MTKSASDLTIEIQVIIKKKKWMGHMHQTCMQHPRLQKHEDLVLQVQFLYIVPSYRLHKDEAAFGMD